jgi:hypothetical protein
MEKTHQGDENMGKKYDKHRKYLWKIYGNTMEHL